MTPGTDAGEYRDSMVALLEWIDLAGKRVLDIGCGIGGPAFVLARKYGAHVTGIDLEPRLIERASRREYERMRGEGMPRVVELIGEAEADHMIEDWRSMVVVCEKGELHQGYTRGRRPQIS